MFLYSQDSSDGIVGVWMSLETYFSYFYLFLSMIDLISKEGLKLER